MKKPLALYSGILGIIVLLASVGLGMYWSGLGILDDRPISYLGLDESSGQIFANGLIISALLFIHFGFQIRKIFPTNKAFIILLILGQIFQIVAALAVNEGSTKILHTISAFGIVFTLPALMWQFAKTQPDGHFKDV